MEIYEYPDRTIEQHKSEWLYYQMISDFTGHTAYEVYEYMAGRILRVVDEDGELGYIKPTSLNTVHHNLYMEQIRMIAAVELNLILPDPDKKYILRNIIKKTAKRK